jgi:DNA mismatch repair protein MutH
MFEGSSIIKNGNRKLVGFKKVVFSENDIDNFGKTYDLIKKAIEKKDIRILPRPKYFENQYLVLAPKGVKGDKAYLDFLKSNKTKACLMLEKEFISQKLLLIPNNLHQSSLS